MTSKEMRKAARKLRHQLSRERQALEGLAHSIAKKERRLADLTELDPGEYSALARDEQWRREERTRLHTSYTPEMEREDDAWDPLPAYHPSRY